MVSPDMQSEEFLSEEAKRQRRSLWMVRSFLLILGLSVCVNIILLIALKSLFPLERVQPFFLKVEDKKDQIIRIVRPDTANLDMQKVSEALVRQYLLNRLSIVPDMKEMEQRWGLDGVIMWNSSEPVYQEFSKDTPRILQQAAQMALERRVVIQSLTPVKRERAGSEIWRANLELSDMTMATEEPEKTYWDVKLRVAYQPFQRGIAAEHRLKNPMGFRVIDYTLSRRERTVDDIVNASAQGKEEAETRAENVPTQPSVQNN